MSFNCILIDTYKIFQWALSSALSFVLFGNASCRRTTALTKLSSDAVKLEPIDASARIISNRRGRLSVD